MANAEPFLDPSIASFLDRHAISLPCHEAGDAPVGLTPAGEAGAGRKPPEIAAVVEKRVSPV